MNAALAEGGRERILALALQYAGLDNAPDHSGALLEAAVSAASAVCGRRDVPEEMECAVAMILSGLYRDGFDRPVSSVKRGDTAITYASGNAQQIRLLLAPFMRLHTPGGGHAHG